MRGRRDRWCSLSAESETGTWTWPDHTGKRSNGVNTVIQQNTLTNCLLLLNYSSVFLSTQHTLCCSVTLLISVDGRFGLGMCLWPASPRMDSCTLLWSPASLTECCMGPGESAHKSEWLFSFMLHHKHTQLPQFVSCPVLKASAKC